MQYILEVIEVSRTGVAFFKCNNGDYGYFDCCSVDPGDTVVLDGTIGCGMKNATINGQTPVRVNICCLNSKEDAYMEFKSV